MPMPSISARHARGSGACGARPFFSLWRCNAMPDGQVEGEMWEGGGRRYRMEKVVGNGAFGIVWRAREEGGTESVAIKKVVLDRRYHNRELEMMKGLDHECVIKLHHSFEKPCVPRAPRRPLRSTVVLSTVASIYAIA